MKLKLENFRCHKKATFDIPDRGLVLLSGASGAGKTTILNAIAYALYGNLPKPYSHDQPKCSVEIGGYRIPGSEETLHIIRTSPGSRLKVTTADGKGYEDDAAQGVIDSLVVPHEKFLLSSYVVQRLQSSILSLPPRDQVGFIKTLASVGDCNNAFRSRIQQKIGHYEARASHLEGEVSVIQRQFESAAVPPRPAARRTLCPDSLRSTVHRLERDLDEARETNAQLEGAKLRRQKEAAAATQGAALADQIASLKKQLAQLDFCTDSELAEFEREASFLKRAAAFRAATLNLERLRGDLVRADGPRRGKLKAGLLSPEALVAYQKEGAALRADHGKAAAAAAVVAAAKTEIANLSGQASTRWNTKLKKGPAALQAFFDKKSRQLEKLGAQFRQKIDDLSRRDTLGETYTCPSCETRLSLEDGQLALSSAPPAAPPLVDYKALVLENQHKAAQIEDDLKTLASLASRFALVAAQSKAKVLPASKLALFLKKIDTLEKTILTSEQNRQELESIAAAGEILAAHRQKAETILHEGDTAKLAALEGADIRPRLDRAVELMARKRLNKEAAVALSAEIQAKQAVLDRAPRRFPNALDELEQVEKQLEAGAARQKARVIEFQQARKDLEEALEFQTYQTALGRRTALLKEKEGLERSLGSVHDKILGFQGLNSLCKKADIAATDATIADINFNAAFYTKELFAEAIQIALSRVRTTLKGVKRDGMTTNVVYKGSVYSNLDQLSGGERQRCNLAFILGVNDIVGSPFLLLDECLNNLDGETHTFILDFLRQTCQGKLILVVAHEAAAAKFDEVVAV